MFVIVLFVHTSTVNGKKRRNLQRKRMPTLNYSVFSGTIWWLKMNMLNRNEVWCSDPFRHHPVNFAGHLKWGYEPWFTGNDGHEKTPSIWIVSLCIKPRHSLVFLPALLLAILSEPWNCLKLMKWTKNGRWRTKEWICFFKYLFSAVFFWNTFVQDLLLTPGSISTNIFCVSFALNFGLTWDLWADFSFLPVFEARVSQASRLGEPGYKIGRVDIRVNLVEWSATWDV